MFGGVHTEYLRSCEKMDLGKVWTGLGSMTHPKGMFTPCLLHSLFYLISCWECSNRTVETFNPETQVFTVLSVVLPPSSLDTASVAFVVGEELCVLTDNKLMLRWKVGAEREFRISNTGEVLWSSQQPLIVGSIVLIACCGGVNQFSLDTYSSIKRIA